MLFACSGLPLPCGRSKLELARYVTSACLATEYESKRYRDDKLRVVAASYFSFRLSLFIQSQFGRHVLMCCFYHYRFRCAFRMIEKKVGS
jgi:hypothetical protein